MHTLCAQAAQIVDGESKPEREKQVIEKPDAHKRALSMLFSLRFMAIARHTFC